MAFIDNYNLENLVNEAERLVLEELTRQLEAYQGEICLCNDCVVDMAAMALNAVKPLYRYSLLGTLWVSSAMEDEAYASSLQDAVSNAIERIRANPSHD
jgi:competence protein ComFB